MTTRHSISSIRKRSATRSDAFSLIELMIAIVILGLGMVMVASMFPIALGRARNLTEQARSMSITSTADTILSMIASSDSLGADVATFAGDMVYDNSTAANDAFLNIVTYSDDRVHLLHMENVRVAAPRGYVPSRTAPWNDPLAPWRNERLRIHTANAPGAPEMSDACGPPGTPPAYCLDSFLSPRLKFEARLYPPLSSRDPNTLLAGGAFLDDTPDTRWEEMLDTRRYAWAVLHRLRSRVGPPDPGTATPSAEVVQEAFDAANKPREFDLYYVTLRRPSSTLRFARQDPNTSPNPYLLSGQPRMPEAMPPGEDVVLPEPWRVQIQLPALLGNTTQGTTTGIPTEVQVPPDGLLGGQSLDLGTVMLAQMFQRGTRFIDEITGQVFRVVKRRVGPAGDRAFLTLDREITLEDVDLPSNTTLCNCNTVAQQIAAGIDPAPDDPAERIRTVWVFPPPVQAGRMDSAALYPAFDGPQPVIAIESRSLTFVP